MQTRAMVGTAVATVRWGLALVLAGACAASQGDAEEGASDKPPEAATTAEEATPTEAADRAPEKLAAPVERRLYPQSFTASSHLENDWNKFQENYLPQYLGDDDPKTSWTEGKADVGLGESVRIEHTPLEDATALRLEIRNGYQKTPKLFKRNARAKDITIKLLPSGNESKHTLADKEGWQSVTLTQPEGKLSGYEIVFNSVYAGSKYKDLVVSDVQTFVTSKTPDNPSFETSKRDRLLAWINDRKEAARTFKEAAKGSMPIASSYRRSDDSSVKGEDEDSYYENAPEAPFTVAAARWKDQASTISVLEEAAGNNYKDWVPLRIAAEDKRQIPQIDNFMFPQSWHGQSLFYMGDQGHVTMPIPRQMGFFQAKSLKRVYDGTAQVTVQQVLEKKAPACKKEDTEATFYFTPETEGPLTSLLIASCGMYEDRDGYNSTSYWQLLTFNKQGRLTNLFDYFSANRYIWEMRNKVPFLAKIERVSTASRQHAATTFDAQ